MLIYSYISECFVWLFHFKLHSVKQFWIHKKSLNENVLAFQYAKNFGLKIFTKTGIRLLELLQT